MDMCIRLRDGSGPLEEKLDEKTKASLHHCTLAMSWQLRLRLILWNKSKKLMASQNSTLSFVMTLISKKHE